VKRSKAVNLVLLASTAVTLEGCRKQECVDENNVVVDSKYCQGLLPPQGPHGYRWYNGSFFAYYPIGSNATSQTTRGVFGAAGDSAAHGSGATGDGAGAGE
jgi:hypothetical protein